MGEECVLTTKKSKKPPRPIPGTVHANIQIPEHLHDSMKAIRAERHKREGADVKLCRIYREAVEQYVNAEPQQHLLKEAGDGVRKTVRAGGHRLTARV
jgi:hypothetical protein